MGLDLGIALGDFPLVTFVELEGLAQITEQLFAPVTLQTLGHGVGAGLNPVIFSGGKRGRVAFAGQERAENGQARHAADVTDDIGEWHVHCGESLLPVLDAGGRSADEGVALAHVGPSYTEVIGGTESAVEPPEGVEFWPPLAVSASGFAAGHVFGVAGVDQVDGKTPRFQNLEEGDPVDSRAFHDHGIDLASLAPVGHGMKVGRNARNPAHGLWRAIRRHGNVVLGTAHVDPGGIEMQLWQSSGRIRRLLGCSMFFAGFGHRRPFGVRRVRCKGAVRPGCGTG